MKENLTLLALLQLVISLFVAVICLLIAYKVVKKVVGKKYEIKNDNIAYAIFLGAILFAVGYLILSAIDPLLTAFRVLNNTMESTLTLILQFSKYLGLFLIISLGIALVVVLSGAYLFITLNHKLNELEEIGKNNIAVGIVTGVIVIVIALFVKSGVVLLLESLIPYPDLPGVY